ncbi:unnamed protein product [Ectocarpus fasciculatus]
MFMCDKAPVQRELAENLAGLLSLFKDDRAEGVRFFKSFCVTMQRDWERIDNLRIDKYYTLVRVFVREALAFCRLPRPPAEEVQQPKKTKKKGKKNPPTKEMETSAKAGGGVWDLGLLGAMSDVMEVEVLTLRPAPIGLRLHLADVWAEEACNAGGGDMPTEAFLVALAPWLRVAAEPETNPVVFKRTFEGVFEGLLELFPEDKDRMEEDEEEEKKVFATVEMDQVQACLFEVAAAPQTRDKRRVKLYELHRRYQKRTGVAPDASAPPSGILPLPEESESDDDEEGEGDGEYDGEYVEAGARRRAVRGPEPAVAGWVAAGIASGDISSEGGEEGGGRKAKKRRKRSGSEDDEAGVDNGGEKKKKRRTGVEEEEEEASAKKRKKKSKGSVEKDNAEAAGAEAPPAAAPAGVEAGADAEAETVTPGKKSTKKLKKEQASPPAGVSNGAVTGEGTAAAANGDGVSSPPPSGKHKKKKKRRGSADGAATDAGDDAAAAVSTATAAAPEAEVAAAAAAAAGVVAETLSSSSKKKKKKSKGEEEVATPDAGESETTPEDGTMASPDSSSEKKKKKKKKKKKPPSLEEVASPTPSPGNTASEEVSAPSSGSFRTPPKKAGGGGGGGSSSKKKKKKKSPAAGESARKTVTFGANMAKEHQTSVKDLKTRVITPSKDAGTPQKGLLKVGGGGSGVKLMKPAAGRKDTPYAGKKKASDYF